MRQFAIDPNVKGLDIGPDQRPRWVQRSGLRHFTRLDAVDGPYVDVVADCRKLPFGDCSFDVVHSSHVLEHIDWWETDTVLDEWARVTKHGGRVECWFPDANKIMKALLHFDDTGEWFGPEGDDMGRYLAAYDQRDPYRWCVKHLLNYPLEGNEFQRHRALLTGNYVIKQMMRTGRFHSARVMDISELRGRDHPWINVGVVGFRK